MINQRNDRCELQRYEVALLKFEKITSNLQKYLFSKCPENFPGKMTK